MCRHRARRPPEPGQREPFRARRSTEHGLRGRGRVTASPGPRSAAVTGQPFLRAAAARADPRAVEATGPSPPGDAGAPAEPDMVEPVGLGATPTTCAERAERNVRGQRRRHHRSVPSQAVRPGKALGGSGYNVIARAEAGGDGPSPATSGSAPLAEAGGLALQGLGVTATLACHRIDGGGHQLRGGGAAMPNRPLGMRVPEAERAAWERLLRRARELGVDEAERRIEGMAAASPASRRAAAGNSMARSNPSAAGEPSGRGSPASRKA